MYKAVNINQDTYEALHKIAIQLNKPKAQVVASLVREYGRTLRGREKAKLDKFNKEMGAKIKALTFSKQIKVTTDTIDTDFASLAKTDYMK